MRCAQNSDEPLATAIGNEPDELALLNRVVESAIDLVDHDITRHAELEKRPGYWTEKRGRPLN